MTDWRTLAKLSAHTADEGLDRVRAWFEDRRTDPTPIVAVPYLTYGTSRELWVHGRVLRNPGIVPAADDDRLWHNAVRAYRRFFSNEIAGATVVATRNDASVETTTDVEGYFDITLPETDVSTGAWNEVALAATHRGSTATATARVMVPANTAKFLVVSDIDDTVLHTQATSLMRMIRNTVVENARTRLPFNGVQELYEALRRGPSGKGNNPIFYVSNGPWNLFDFLADFMDINDLPPGPILLRDYGFDETKFLTDSTHKARTIERILAAFPELPAVLIGDSGEHDPEIYREIALQNPGRIAAIYIRAVAEEKRDSRVAAIADCLENAGVEMVLVEDSAGAAKHAVSHELMTAEAARTVAGAAADSH